jgi:4-hydroxy-4-methyl-2-oxoglutarate aldolase
MTRRTRRLAATLSGYDTPTIANAIETYLTRDMTEGYASSLVRRLTPRSGPMVGYAVTVMFDSTTPSAKRFGPAGWFDLMDVVKAAPKPAVVVCQYVGPERERGCWLGDVIATLMARLGTVGTVTDTSVRDVSTIVERLPSFHVFAAGTVASHGNGKLIAIDVPVSVGGMSVHPGDLIHGDENGVITIPLDVADGLTTRAQEGVVAEAEFVRLLQSDPLPYDDVRERLRH